MVICVEFKKVKELNNIHVYNIETDQFGGANLYIIIDAKNKKLSFYPDDSCEEAVVTVDFNDPDKPVKCASIAPRIVWAVVSVVTKALESGIFPETTYYMA